MHLCWASPLRAATNNDLVWPDRVLFMLLYFFKNTFPTIQIDSKCLHRYIYTTHVSNQHKAKPSILTQTEICLI